MTIIREVDAALRRGRSKRKTRERVLVMEDVAPDLEAFEEELRVKVEAFEDWTAARVDTITWRDGEISVVLVRGEGER